MKNIRGQECASNPLSKSPENRRGSRSQDLSAEGRKRTLSNIEQGPGGTVLTVPPGLLINLTTEQALLLWQLRFWTKAKSAIVKDGKRWARVTTNFIQSVLRSIPRRTLFRIIGQLESMGALERQQGLNNFNPDRANWITVSEKWLNDQGNLDYNPFDNSAKMAPSTQCQNDTPSQNDTGKPQCHFGTKTIVPKWHDHSAKIARHSAKSVPAIYKSNKNKKKLTDTTYQSAPRGEARGTSSEILTGGVKVKASEISTVSVDQDRLKKMAKKLEARVTLPVFIDLWREMAHLATGQRQFSFTPKERGNVRSMVKWLAENEVKAISFIQFTIDNWKAIRAATRWPDSKKYRLSEQPRFEEAFFAKEEIVRMLNDSTTPTGEIQRAGVNEDVFTSPDQVPLDHPHRQHLLKQIAKHGLGKVTKGG